MVYLIKEMPENERPRERLIAHGTKALSLSELLAILLETGNKNESVLDLSKRILYELEKTSKLSDITYQELILIRGVKAAKACKILAAIELGKRLSNAKKPELKKITSPQDVYLLLNQEVSSLKQETLYAIYLNTQSEIIAFEKLYTGTLNQLLIHPRDIFKRAYQLNAHALILAHNHPSGNATPSKADLSVTENLINVGSLLQIELIDHVVLGSGEFYSIKADRKYFL